MRSALALSFSRAIADIAADILRKLPHQPHEFIEVMRLKSRCSILLSIRGSEGDHVLEAEGETLEDATLERMEEIWQAAKAIERAVSSGAE